MTTSPAKETSVSKKFNSHKHIARLDGATLDPDSGLYIGTITIGRQLLRVGIRPPVVPDEERGHKHPLMLFNGMGGNMEVSGPFLSELVHTEAVIFDIPGTGGSPTPRLPYRFFSMARLASKLLDKLGYEKIDVIGVSWGGGLAQQFAMQYPKKVRRLVLAATVMGGTTMIPGSPKTLLKMVNPRRYREEAYMKSIAAEIYGGHLRLNPDFIHSFTDRMFGTTQRGYLYQLLAITGWTGLPWLWRIPHPTLIMAGDDDPLVPLVNARIHKKLMKNARLHIFSDGHLFMLSHNHETALVVDDFLK